jgi:hypothetical protein
MQAPMPILNWDRALGLAIVAVVPALFWTFLAYLAAPMFGAALGFGALMVLAGGIAAFLGLIYAVVSAAS